MRLSGGRKPVLPLLIGFARSLSTAPKRVVIFCHGSGDSGEGARVYVENTAPLTTQTALRDAGIVFEYPTAELRPYRLSSGRLTRVWFDRYEGMDPRYEEDTSSVEAGVNQVMELIDDLVDRQGVTPDRIALGGFSMGGGIALQTAVRSRYKFGAVFALSSYLCDQSWVWGELERCRANQQKETEGGTGLVEGRTPVLMALGEADGFVLPRWTEATANRLREGGVNVQPILRVPSAGHEMTSDELRALFQFLLDPTETTTL